MVVFGTFLTHRVIWPFVTVGRAYASHRIGNSPTVTRVRILLSRRRISSVAFRSDARKKTSTRERLFHEKNPRRTGYPSGVHHAYGSVGLFSTVYVIRYSGDVRGGGKAVGYYNSSGGACVISSRSVSVAKEPARVYLVTPRGSIAIAFAIIA